MGREVIVQHWFTVNRNACVGDKTYRPILHGLDSTGDKVDFAELDSSLWQFSTEKETPCVMLFMPPFLH